MQQGSQSGLNLLTPPAAAAAAWARKQGRETHKQSSVKAVSVNLEGRPRNVCTLNCRCHLGACTAALLLGAAVTANVSRSSEYSRDLHPVAAAAATVAKTTRDSRALLKQNNRDCMKVHTCYFGVYSSVLHSFCSAQLLAT